MAGGWESVMERNGDSMKQKSGQSTDEPRADMQSLIGLDVLHDWAKIVEQDSQTETIRYLGESIARSSGE
jgi:hypothetical protein